MNPQSSCFMTTRSSTRNKELLRSLFHHRRRQISQKRRQEASEALIETILALVSSLDVVLSYASFADELCSWKLNQHLATTGQLLLPSVVNQTLHLYHVEDIKKQLFPNRWGIFEPQPEICQRVFLQEISLVVVPGIAFDSSCHRLGYGKGFYDRLLATHHPHSVGVGFAEQHSLCALPTNPHDVVLSEVFFF